MYDFKITLQKAAWALARSTVAVASAAVLTFLSDGTSVQAILEQAGLSKGVIMATAPLIHSAITALQNYRKHA